MSRMRVIRLFPDDTAEWPLWESEEKGEMSPDDYGLSPELRELMRQWQQFWDQHHNSNKEPYWDSDENLHSWLEFGKQVEAVLRREVQDFAVVEARYR